MVNHLLFQCDYAIAIWRTSNLPITSLSSSNTLEQNIECLLNVHDSCRSPEVKHAPFWILWQLWKSRNDLIFNKINHDSRTMVSCDMDNVLEWLGATNPKSDTNRSSSPTDLQKKWQSPPTGFLKYNIDASYHYNSASIVVGWIL